jgi:hypothetical protein
LAVCEAIAARGEPEDRSALIGRLDGGKRMLVQVWKNGAPGPPRLLLAEFDDGKLRFEPLKKKLHMTLPYDMWAVNDNDGSLWISSRNVLEHCLSAYVEPELYSSRITSSGVAERPADSGWPWLRDRAGNIWFGPQRDAVGSFQLRRNGRLVQEINFPDTDRVLGLVAPVQGSVYAFVSGGLLHLKAEGPDFKNYRPAEFYDIGPFTRTYLHARDLGDGWIAVSTRPQQQHHYASNYLFKLPLQPNP